MLPTLSHPNLYTRFLVLGIFLAGLLSACSIDQRLVPPAGPLAGVLTTPTAAPEAPERASSPSAPGLPECLINLTRKEQAKVTVITDGDTIHVDLNGEDEKVRYIGIDSPEIHGQVDFYGPEASAENAALVDGQTVMLYRDHSNTDRYGRLLRYVVVGDDFVNLTLVRLGYAYAKDYPPDTACSKEFHTAEAQARREKLGLWRKP